MATGRGSTYEEIMCLGKAGSTSGANALGSRLVSFRKWLAKDAKCRVHPNVCIVNGEATDGTKNAPVLLFGPSSAQSSSAASGAVGAGEGRCGIIDEDNDRALFDRTMGCQVRVAKELKKDEVMMTIPRCSMITPDLISASDAGRAVLACFKASDSLNNFWDAFENTAGEEKRFAERVSSNSATQVLVKILQERKKAERVLTEAERSIDGGTNPQFKLAGKGAISTRAPVLAFLLQQRFANALKPAVTTDAEVSSVEINDNSDDAVAQVPCIRLPDGTPDTFAPYARTLPSYVSLPICWKRNELALLAGCIPGLVPLQEVAARTMQLSSDLIALVESGILHRFPHIFPRGLITWDRWVWAASCFTSRALPASCYLNKGEKSAHDHVMQEGELFYSPPDVWDELGVMIPLLDMLNHESTASQVKWESPVPPGTNLNSTDEDGTEGNDSETISIDANLKHEAEVVIHKKVKKGSQIYTNYGLCSNQNFTLQYGFAQINNPSDEVRIGWGLMDAVGGVASPADFSMCPDDLVDSDSQYLVFESSDPMSINRWWTESRLVLLEEEARVDGSPMSNLKAGRKLNVTAYSEGVYDPIFLSAAVVATMPPQGVRNRLATIRSDREEVKKTRPTLSKRHQRILRQYIIFLFSRKLEKLLQNLSNGLKDHFNNVQLWTKSSEGGLAYNAALAADGIEENGSAHPTGWQHFFDLYAYTSSMEVEKRYYAMGSDSCVLSLYDGSLRSLQSSLDGALSAKDFEEGTLKQLLDLGYALSEEDEDSDNDVTMADEEGDEVTGGNEKPAPGDLHEADTPSGDVTVHSTAECEQGGDERTTEEMPPDDAKAAALDRSRNRRNRKKGDRAPAIKLHIGNLSYQTTPSSLFDFFAGIYGKENVLECHIPTERDSGRSRGFGFVTMPEEAASQALQSDGPHEIDGRLLKLAESNTAGSGRKNQASASGGPGSSDRCSTCGYRPKYCTCSFPNMPGHSNHGGAVASSYPPDEMYGPPNAGMMDPHDFGSQYGKHNPEHDSHGGVRRRSRSWNNRGRSASRSPSPWSGGGRGGHHRESRYHSRGRRDYRGRSYSRSRSRSYSRSRDRDRDRDRRDRDSGRASERDRESRSSGRRGGSSRSSGGGWASRSSRSSRYSRSRSRSHSRSRSYGKGSPSRQLGDRDRKSNGAGADNAEKQRRRSSRSRSWSPPPSHARAGTGSGGGSDKKREGKSRNRSRSRSRSRGRSGRRKRSSKDRHRKESSKRRSRSRSWSKGD